MAEQETSTAIPEIVNQYLFKTGLFDPEDGDWSGWSADNVTSEINSKPDQYLELPQNIKDHFTELARKESAEVTQGEGEIVGGVQDVAGFAHDQVKGLTYGFYNPVNSAYKAQTGEDLLPPPVTAGGEVAAIVGQTGASLLTGSAVAKGVGALLPTTLLTKVPSFITQFLSKQGLTGSRVVLDSTKKAGLQVVTKGNALKPLGEAAKVGVGEAITLNKEYRLSRLISDMFGIDDGPIADMAGIEDKGFFEETWDGFVDGTFTYMGGTLLVPALKIFGRKLWEAGAFATDQVASNELVAPALKYLKKEFETLQKNFEEIYPKSVISSEDASIKVEKDIQKQVNKHKGQKKRAATIAAKKKGKGKKGTEETVQVDDGLRGLEEDPINWAELSKKPTNFEKIKGLLNLKLINAESDVIKTLEILNHKIRSKVTSTTMEELNTASEKLLIDLKGLKVDPVNLVNMIGTHAKDLPVQLLAAQTLLISQGRQFINVSKRVNDKRIKRILLEEQLGSIPQAEKMQMVSQQAKEAGIDKASKEELMEVLEEYLRLRHIHKVVNGARSDTGLALRVLQEVKDGNMDIGALYTKMGVDLEKVSKVSDGKSWEQAVEALAEQVADFTNPSQAVNTVGGSAWHDIFNVVNFTGINAMLSTPATWAVNFGGTGVMAMIETKEKYMAALFTKVQKASGINVEGATTFDEANSYAYGQIQALLEWAYHTESDIYKRSAIAQGKKAFVAGKTNSGLLNHELTQQGHTVTNQTLGNSKWGVPDAISQDMLNKYLPEGMQIADNGAISNIVNATSIGIGVPGRILLGQDAIFRGMTYRGVVFELARKRAKQLAGQGASEDVINARYRELVMEVPEDIHNAADIASSITVFQEELTKKGLGIEQTVAIFERLRNVKLDPQMKKAVGDGLVQNAVTSFLLSKLPFIRTPYNITKQMLVKRGPVRAATEVTSLTKDAIKSIPHALEKTANTGANLFRSKGNKVEFVGESPFLTNRFINDPGYRSDALAKMTFGSTLFGSGYYFYNSGEGRVIGDNKYKIELSSKENKKLNLTDQRDLDSEEGIIPPAITKENILNGDFNVLAIGRGDPLAQLISMGAVYGKYDELATEIEALEADHTITDEQAAERRQELSALMFYHVGSILYEKAGLQGVKEVLMHSGATGHPYADPGKMIAEFAGEWLGGPPYSGFTKGLHRALENKKVFPLGKQKRKMVYGDESEDGSTVDYINGLANSKIPLYQTLPDGSTKPLSPDKIESLGVFERAFNAWIDNLRKSYILDPTLDIVDYFVNDGKSPIKRGACQMIDLEGHPKGFTEPEATIFKRVYEQFLSPLSFRKVQKTNTSTLIRKLDIKFSHPKRWINAPVVNSGGETVPIDPTQQCHWALGYGIENRNTFNTPRFNTLVHILEGKSVKDIPTTKLKVPILAQSRNVRYKYVSKYLPMKELNYDFIVGENDIAEISGATLLGMKEEVTKQLQSNRQRAFQGMKGEPRFISLLRKMKELQVAHNPGVATMQEPIVQSGRLNKEAETTANQLLNRNQ